MSEITIKVTDFGVLVTVPEGFINDSPNNTSTDSVNRIRTDVLEWIKNPDYIIVSTYSFNVIDERTKKTCKHGNIAGDQLIGRMRFWDSDTTTFS